jgi:catalytic LigB subunit of aromatic ring-opening dioxygenase
MAMADIVLGIGTSHTPLLSLPAEYWPAYAQRDQGNPELAYPPHGHVMPWQRGLETISPELRAGYKGTEVFAEQSAACTRALTTLTASLKAAEPDITIIISDDQDELFYEDNMPRFSVYWGDTIPLMPRALGPGGRGDSAITDAVIRGYGDVPMDVPVASRFGRFLVEHLSEHDFDVAHFTHLSQPYGGKVARRYPTPDGELNYVKETASHDQGLPHGFSFIVARLFENQPRPILPVFQNTCYPPNQPTPRRSFAFGEAIAAAIRDWSEPARVALVASGGLSHFVVDEELDRMVLGGLERKDAAALKSLPRERLYSAASESMNWVALGGAMHDTDLKFELLDYVPVYRSAAATGGGWAFAQWR